MIVSSASRLSLHPTNKMAERFAKVNEQEIRELLDNTTPKIPCLSIKNYKTIIPFALVVYELIANSMGAI